MNRARIFALAALGGLVYLIALGIMDAHDAHVLAATPSTTGVHDD